ncbi:MAG: hypothetical protein V8Q32_03535, partial [Anaerotignum faecicola]
SNHLGAFFMQKKKMTEWERILVQRLALTARRRLGRAYLQLISQLKNLGSEMKSVVSELSGMENSEGTVTAKGDVLKRSLNASAEKMKLLQNQSERAKARLATL